jgi:hypothetical protein
MQYIPFSSQRHFEQKVFLVNKYYYFVAMYNTISDAYSISLYDDARQAVVLSKKLLLNVDLLANCYELNKPSCVIVALAEDASIQRVTQQDLITEKTKLMYVVQ